MNLAISVKNKKKTAVVSGITVGHDKFIDKDENVNSLLKPKQEEPKLFLLASQEHKTYSILNYVGLYLNVENV